MTMNVDGSLNLKATDAGFLLGSLTEPLQTIARHAIPPSLVGLASAATRTHRLEIELRGTLIDLLVIKESMDTLVDIYKSSLDVCVHLVHFCELGQDERYSDMAVRKLPLLLLEDVLEGLSLRDGKNFWERAVEPQLDMLFSNLFWETSAVCHLPFLKVCNKFLRRLQMGPTPEEWTGRVLWTLSRGFGIADKSATKVWGSFHTSNVTTFEAPQEFHHGGHGHPNQNQDYSLYQAFWSLQKEFSNPNTIQVAEFLKKMRIVLGALESTHQEPKTTTRTSIQDSSPPPPPPPPGPTTPKYLTSSSLLPLQLATLDFRIHVLTQFLIVASHLSSESPPLANALSTLQQRAKQLLRLDHPEHLAILESILQREQHWRAWKKTKCKASAFSPPYGDAKDEETPNKKKRRLLLDGPLGLGNDEDQDRQQGHDFTLMDADELATISKSMVEAVPTLDQHLVPYIDALDPDAGIEAEYHPKNDPIFSWRAMRLYTKHQVPLLHMCSKSGDFERMTRKYYQTKGREIPGIMPEASDDGSVSSDESKAEEEDPQVEEDEPETEKEEHHSEADEGGEEEDIEMEAAEKYKKGHAAYERQEADDGEEDGNDEKPIEEHKTLKGERVEAVEEDRENQESVEEDTAQPMKIDEEPQTRNVNEDDSKKSVEAQLDSSNVKQDDGEVKEVVSDSASSSATSDSDEQKEEAMEQTVKKDDKDQPGNKDSSRDRDKPPAKQEQQVSSRNSGPTPGGGGRHGGRNPPPRGRGGAPARGRSDEGRGGRESRGHGGRRSGRGGGGRGSDDGGGRGGDDRGGRGGDDRGGRGGDDRGGRGGDDRGGRGGDDRGGRGGDDRGGRGDSRRGPGPREDRNRGERRGGRDDNDDRRWRGRR
jgi:THO complex subunit 1